MALFVEGRGLASEAEPVGLLTEGAAGIAVIVLSVIALAGTSPGALASIVTIIIGVGLMVQAFNSAAENSKLMAAAPAAIPDLGGEMAVDCLRRHRNRAWYPGARRNKFRLPCALGADSVW